MQTPSGEPSQVGTPTTADGEAVSANTTPTADPASAEVPEEIRIIGERVRDPNPVQVSRTRNAHGKGSRLYRQKRYAEALPYLLEAARQGFKLSQARVAFIYQQGLDGVPRDGRAAIGWLGVAASGSTDPVIRNHFNRAMARVPVAQRTAVDAIIAEYTAAYGSGTTGVVCRNVRVAGTHLARLKCEYVDEHGYRDTLDGADLPGQFVIEVGTGPA